MATRENRNINLNSISDAALAGISRYTLARAEWANCKNIADKDARLTASRAARAKMAVAAFDVLATPSERSDRTNRENIARDKGKLDKLPAPVSTAMADACKGMVDNANPDTVFRAYSALFERMGVDAGEKGLRRAVRFMAVAANATRYGKDGNDLIAASKQTANTSAMNALVKLLEHAGFQHDKETGALTRPAA